VVKYLRSIQPRRLTLQQAPPGLAGLPFTLSSDDVASI